jgi:hypothetical protein
VNKKEKKKRGKEGRKTCHSGGGVRIEGLDYL